MRRTSLLALLGLVGLTFAVVACSSSDPDVSSGPTRPPGTGTTVPIANSMMTTTPASEIVTGDTLVDQRFVSTSVEGHDLVAGSTISLSFTETGLSVNAGCNTMNGTYRIEGGMLVVEADLQTTMMACEEDLMAQDTWLAEWLVTSPTITATGSGIALAGGDVTIELEPEATGGAGGSEGAAGLVGPTWTVHTLVSGDVASSLPAGAEAPTFTFTDDGTLAVFTGCNRGSTSYEASEDGILTVEPAMMTMMACTEPAGQQTETAILALLDGGGIGFAFEGTDLVLRTLEGGVVASPT